MFDGRGVICGERSGRRRSKESLSRVMGGGFKRREHTEAFLLPSTRDSQKCCQIVDAMFSDELLPQRLIASMKAKGVY